MIFSVARVRFYRCRFSIARVMGAVCVVNALQGCVPVAATAIGATAFGIVDRRTFGAQVEDQSIQIRGNQRLREALPGTETQYATVTAFNRRVLLVGQAPDEATRARAAQLVGTLGNVRLIHNEIRVGTAVISAARDTALTARVKASLFEAKDLDATAIKVVSENNIVYLMGLVTQREADEAARQVSQVPSVTRVVTLFDLLSEQEFNRLRPSHQPAPVPLRP